MEYDRLMNLNENFGKGVFTRHLYLSRPYPSQLKAALKDDCHIFELTLHHDDDKIKSVKADWQVYPTTTCPGAANALMEVTDLPLMTDVQALREQLNVRHQCTHMSDLFIYATLHLAHGRDKTHYHIEIPDPQSEDNETAIIIRVNGQIAWEGSAGSGCFASPPHLTGAPLRKGFLKWVTSNLDAKEIEYALMAQQAYFVSISRRYDQTNVAGLPSKYRGPGIDVCFAMQSERVEESYRLNIDNSRLITHPPDFWNPED